MGLPLGQQGSSTPPYQAQLSSTIFLQELFKQFGLNTPSAGSIEANKLRSIAPTTEGFRAQAVAKTLGTSGNDFINIVRRLNLQEEAYLNLLNPLKADSAAASKVADFLRVFGQGDQKVFDAIKTLKPEQQLEMKRDLASYVLAQGANVDDLEKYAQSFTPGFVKAYPGIIGLKPGARAAADLGSLSPILSVQYENRRKVLLDDLQKRGEFDEHTVKIARDELKKVGTSNDALNKLHEELITNGKTWKEVQDSGIFPDLAKMGSKPGGEQYDRRLRFGKELYTSLAYTSSQGALHGGARLVLGALSGAFLPETLIAGGLAATLLAAGTGLETYSNLKLGQFFGGSPNILTPLGQQFNVGQSLQQYLQTARTLQGGVGKNVDTSALNAAIAKGRNVTATDLAPIAAQLEQAGMNQQDISSIMAIATAGSKTGSSGQALNVLKTMLQTGLTLTPSQFYQQVEAQGKAPVLQRFAQSVSGLLNNGQALRTFSAMNKRNPQDYINNPVLADLDMARLVTTGQFSQLPPDVASMAMQNLGIAVSPTDVIAARKQTSQISNAGVTTPGTPADIAAAQFETNYYNRIARLAPTGTGLGRIFSTLGILANPTLSPLLPSSGNNLGEVLGISNSNADPNNPQSINNYMQQQQLQAQQQTAQNTSNITSGPLAVDRHNNNVKTTPVPTPTYTISR